ncbi:MAG: glycerol-3-phosphate dehydrogenase subunit GlpB [Anaerolineales bacterium]
MTYDTIVIGAGYAGLAAALTLAQSGQRVLLLAKGFGGTHLRTGAIDVLGYFDQRRVTRPLDELPAFSAAQPDHPWARLGTQAARQALQFFLRVMRDLDYPFAGTGEENFLLPTALGVLRPSALVPQTMAAGDLRVGGEFAIVGFPNFKDFYPALIADNLNQARLSPPVRARAVTLMPPGFEDEADATSGGLAQAFERAEFRARLVEALRPGPRPGERVGFPAVLGLNDSLTVLSDLQARLSAPVFEIPTLPPSIPGMRIFRALERALREAGARVQIGHPVIETRAAGRRVQAVVTQAAARPQIWKAHNFILATGGIASNGLLVESNGAAREYMFNLPLAGVPAPGEPRFRPGYFDQHPFSGVGLAVNERMQPLAGSEPVFENLYAIGALLAHAEPWREKSGEGLSLASAYRAAQSILETQPMVAAVAS